MPETTEIGGLRMVFEGEPEGLLDTIHRVETRVHDMEKDVGESAKQIEGHINHSLDAIGSGTKKLFKQVEAGANSAAKKIKVDLGGVKKEAAAVAPVAQKAAHGINQSLGRMGDKLTNATEGVRKFQGALSGILGVVVGLIAIFGLWTSQIKKTRQDYKEFQDTLGTQVTQQNNALHAQVVATGSLTDAQREELEITKETSDAINEIDKATIKVLENRKKWFGLAAFVSEGDTLKRNVEIIEEEGTQIEKIYRIEKQRLTLLRLQRKLKKIAADEALVESGREEAESQRLANIRDPSKLEAEIHKKKMEDLEEQFGAIKELNRQVYDEIIEQESARHSLVIKAIEEEEAKRQESHQRELDRIKEQGERIRAENQQTIQRAASLLESSFGNESTRLLSTIVKKIDRVSRAARSGGR